jgi:hypothetical protein
MDMRVSVSLRAIGLGLAALVALASPSHATDYFSLDLRHAEFAPEPLGPPAQFVPRPAPAPLPVATIREPAPATQVAAAPSHRVHTARIREAARKPHRNPLNAFASYPRTSRHPCTGTSICVFDGPNGRWYAKR